MRALVPVIAALTFTAAVASADWDPQGFSGEEIAARIARFLA